MSTEKTLKDFRKDIKHLVILLSALIISTIILCIKVNAAVSCNCAYDQVTFSNQQIYYEWNTYVNPIPCIDHKCNGAFGSCDSACDGGYYPDSLTALKVCQKKGYDSLVTFTYQNDFFNSPEDNYMWKWNGQTQEYISAKALNIGIDTVTCSRNSCQTCNCVSNSDCNDNNPSTEDVCVNPSTTSSYCQYNNVVCNIDSDCGTNGFLDPLFCSNNIVYQKYQYFVCNNPGTSLSYCTNSTKNILKEMCQLPQVCYQGKCSNVTCYKNSDCNDSNSSTEDICSNPGTGLSKCSHNLIKCNYNNDCGNNGFFGNLFCSNDNKNVLQNYINFICNSPGTSLSYCSNSSSQLLKLTCSANQICNNGQCMNVQCFNDSQCNDNNSSTFDKCLNPGTAQSSCSHDTIKCSCNSDCGTNNFFGGLYCSSNDLYQDFLTFTCNNPGTNQSYCSNSSSPILKQDCSSNQICSNNQCLNIACFNDSQCNDNNSSTSDKCLNPGTIQSSCSHDIIKCSCNSDCGINGFFGNLFCSDNNVFQNFLTYTCNNPGTVQSSCSNSSSQLLKLTCSNDQICNNGECKNVICFNDSGCNDNNSSTVDNCINPGTIESYCNHNNIRCNCNNDCGTDHNTGNLYCHNNSVYQDFVSYTCNNPGTSLSTCTSITSKQLKTSCSENQICSDAQCQNIVCSNNSECNDNNSSTFDECLNPGTINSTCNHKTITCSMSSECGNNHFLDEYFCSNNTVFQSYISFSCNNPGTSASYCSNFTGTLMNKTCSINQLCSSGKCYDIKCYNDSECDDNDSYTIDTCLNPGTAQSICTHNPVNCNCDSDCGDNKFIDGLFCKENSVYQNFLKFTCNYPGTNKSYCSSSTNSVLNDQCSSDETCSNAECKTKIVHHYYQEENLTDEFYEPLVKDYVKQSYDFLAVNNITNITLGNKNVPKQNNININLLSIFIWILVIVIILLLILIILAVISKR